MKEVCDVRIFERTVCFTFKTEKRLSTQTSRGFRDDSPAKGPRLNIRARLQVFCSGRLEVRHADLRRGQEMMGRRDPSYLIPLFPREQLLKSLFGPCRVLLRYARMPPIQQVELDGYGVSFASRRERVVKVPGNLVG